MMKRRAALIPPAIFGLIALAVCAPTLFEGRSWVPSDYYSNLPLFGGPTDGYVHLANYRQYDIIEHNFNHDSLIHQAFENGEFPLWDPYHFFGQPLHAQPGATVLYPPKLILNYLFSADTAYSLLLFLHLWLAGFGMYILTRRLGMVGAAAILAGVIWMLCGKTAAVFKYSNVLPHLAWLPLVFACCVGVTWRRALLGSLALAMAMLAGHPYFQIASATLLGIFMITRWKGNAAKWGVMAGAAILMCLPILVPAVQLIQNSSRLGFEMPSLEAAPKTLIVPLTMIFPRILGGPVDRINLYKRFELPNAVEFQVYLGVVPLALLLLALFIRKKGATRFFSISALVLLALLFVRPANALIHSLIPGFSEANLYRMSFLFAFCASIAAAGAFHRMLVDPEPFRRAVTRLLRITVVGGTLVLLGTVGIMARGGRPANWINLGEPHIYVPLLFLVGLGVTLWLFTRHRPRAFAATAISLTFVELLLFFRAFNPTHASPLPERTPQAIQRLQTDHPHTRVADALELPYWNTRHPNLLSYYGIRSTGGYDNFLSERYVNWASRIDGTLGRGAPAVIFPDASRLAHLGVEMRLTANLHPLDAASPRAFLTREKLRPGPDDGSDDPYLGRVLLGLRGVESEAPLPVGGKKWDRSLSFEKDGFNEVVLDVRTEKDAVLILNDAYHPNWECTIDGREVEILRANYFLRAVVVPKGTHRVVFRYVPRSLYVCVVIALFTLFGVVMVIIQVGKA